MATVDIPALHGELLRLPAVAALVEEAAGGPVHLVGGVLRDRLLGRETHDLDAVVAGGGRELAERLAERLPARLVLLGGERFAAFRLVTEEVTLDLWDRSTTSLEEDLARRDFTVNAIALDLASGELVDPFGGLGDLQRRRLRATTRESFLDDPLRVLRLARLAAELPGFEADPETIALARASAPEVPAIAAERIREELLRLLRAGSRRRRSPACRHPPLSGALAGKGGRAGPGRALPGAARGPRRGATRSPPGSPPQRRLHRRAGRIRH